MVRLGVIVFLVFGFSGVFAQYGNEWIDATQQYFKIPVAKDGMYRLTYADLAAGGFPTSSADFNRIQLFHRGVEQHIRIQKANLGNTFLEPGDFIEFYGKKNDGASDSVLYQPYSAQPHKYYNLYNDTTFYFLTFTHQVVKGKRMYETTDINSSGIPAETFHTDTRLTILATQYSTGIIYNDYAQRSFFDVGEGWTGQNLAANQSVSYTIEGIANGSVSNGNPVLEILIQGRIIGQHQVQVAVGPSSGSRLLATQIFSGMQPVKITVPLSWTDIGADGKLVILVKALGVDGKGDRLSASYIKVYYPQTFNASSSASKEFLLKPNGTGTSFVQIQNSPAGGLLYDITNPDSVIFLRTVNSTTLDALIPSTNSSRRLLLAGASGYITPSIKPINFDLYNDASPDFIIISHSSLMKPYGSYSNVVQAYADYRSSPAGGNHLVLVANIQQVFDQFNYGEQSPIAIRRFMKFMIENGDPKYLFLIGKALDVNNGYYRNPAAFPLLKDLVPSAGMPGSDMIYTTGYEGINEPKVPTGRITASEPRDVAAYLDKVKLTEALPYNDLWRKNILHLSGGINPGEPETFKGYLEGLGFIAEDLYLGGRVTPVSKGSTDIEFINISDKINSGVSLVTLFGHSSPTTGDFNIGFVSASQWGYSNAGRYPMFLINGCNAGDFFGTTTRYGEDWINTPNKGAIGFIANSSFGASFLLRLYSIYMYDVGYGDSLFIQKGIGDIMKEVSAQFTDVGYTSTLYACQLEQTLLLGDPSVKLFGASKPDYAIDNSSVYKASFDGQPITSQSDSFGIKVVVKNYGRALEDSVKVRVTRTFKDNSSVVYDSIFPRILYQDTLTFVIPRDREKGFDNNFFKIEIDPEFVIGELNENNNTADLTIYIPLNSSRNLFPQGFSIVSDASVNLVVQSTDLLGASREFLIEVDTVDTFDSEYLQQFSVSGKIATQALQLLTLDSTAYYWRTKFANPAESESVDWSTSTFSYIKDGPEGWAQLHFPQYLSNTVTGLTLDSTMRRIDFIETVTDVDVYTFGDANPLSPTKVSLKINGAEYNPEGGEKQCRDNTINIICFSKTTTTPYISIPIQGIQFLDFRACGRRPEVIGSFKTNEVAQADGKNLIEYIEHIAAGDSVVLFSIGNAGYSTWSATVRAKLAEIGISSAQISSLIDGEPVVIFTKKGASPGNAAISRASAPTPEAKDLTVSQTITGRYTKGNMVSGLIGPAQAWQMLIPKFKKLDAADQFWVDVYGYNLQGQKTLLFDSIASLKDLSIIDATAFPYLQLNYYAADTINTTAPQLRNWIVSFTPVPEGVLVFNGDPGQQQLEEGEIWKGDYGFTNISTKSFATDSLTVSFGAFNKSARGSLSGSYKIKSPAPGTTTDFEINLPTKGLSGLNDFDLFVNPRIVPEIYYDNNLLQLNDYLSVARDIYGPVLEVTFDGRYIVDGDFVSHNPTIKILVWDENAFLPKLDTTGLSVYMQYPCNNDACDFTPIYMNRPDVNIHQGSANSDFFIEFKPGQLVAGSYMLQVEASDAVGNPSGDEPYTINFVVTDEDGIHIGSPYPNPSMGIVHFPVVITSSELPKSMKVSIISSNGLNVGDYSYDQMFVGTNDFVWNGRDAHDNLLPPGMYIYRIQLLKADNSIATKIGKLILAR